MKRKMQLTFVCFCMMVTLAGCQKEANQKETEKTSTGQIGKQVETEQAEAVLADADKQDTEQSGTDSDVSDTTSVVVGGYQLQLPADVTPQVNDKGLILTDENLSYEMLVSVRDYAFDEKKEQLDFFSEKVKEAGYEITKEVELITVGDREFAYFTYVDAGDQMLLAYSKADDGHTFANLLIRHDELEDKVYLAVIDSILDTAKETDLPDTTAESLEAPAKDWVESVDMTVGEKAFTISVPEEMYLIEDAEEEGEDRCAYTFETQDEAVNVFLYGGEYAYEEESEWLNETVVALDEYTNVEKSDIQTKEVDGVTVYYQTLGYDQKDYKDEMTHYTELYAVGQVQDGIYVTLQGYASDGNHLSMDMVEKFFEVK